MTIYHRPVLFNEVMREFFVHRDGTYVDATFGRGGHSFGLLNQLGSKGRLLAMDKDPEAVSSALSFCDSQFSIIHENFVNLGRVVRNCGWSGKVTGVLLDLGVSSPQLDDPERGFSFMHDGPLDMRMNPQQTISAAVWLNQASKEDIRCVLWYYGGERYANRIAKEIAISRRKRYIDRTLQLSEIVMNAVPYYERKKHPATRTFQAIRIFINCELDELSKCLPQCLEVLENKGRLCVISFHSLEDRIIKCFIRRESCGFSLKEFPVLEFEKKRRLKTVGNLIRPTEEEVKENPRARSARLRVVEKLM
ncbi:16S rRNA (cytosine(1402)-N(4))-methyltransferase RsmH [Coxiella endosymbiont of Amblyomma sculptum]|uniref:16S rRNA (cytosine(1402)-N(4))-methyltransferase RsmH n=1 Tax=Coxiella endosymbiont of Amblyomma sculptum TaxID=2487929 RepID=UPI00132F1004|nr:16S rRNA (cytosine(1402)-N(4))-methyltransferase RsmH [Coxiella endosymbiont of Amblyomma sculptum]QHG92694.1 16S rRNA (cytosine(1402)-N(4))-methyltransferase RsmH [Coxiella endosymbiont of Amblyomma sculptum]